MPKPKYYVLPDGPDISYIKIFCLKIYLQGLTDILLVKISICRLHSAMKF